MRFSADFLDDIKARLPVSEVVGRRVKLRKAGREWRGLSPFNAEKTPSFYVNDQKGFFHDFSSGRHGNIFDFVMEVDGLSFPEAVERLASEAGLPLPAASPENQARDRRRAGLHEVLELAADFFVHVLHGRGGEMARDYLARRGLTAATQAEFRLGFAPDEKFALREYLGGKGASLETMIEAGLLIHGDDIKVPYDRFRGRVMFPICDRVGKVIAFGGRALDKAVPAKYLNSPETPLFHKGAVLYNQHRARKAAHETGSVIAVEGYVDVIAMASAGFAHTVAPLGTALTTDQCELLWRMAPEPILCFDGDKAGHKAAHRAIDIALPLIGPERSLRFALLPEGQDPDDVVRSGGAAAMQGILAGAEPLVDVLWKREVEAMPLDTPERRAGFERRLADILKTIADESVRRHYRTEFDRRVEEQLGRTGVGSRQTAIASRRPGATGNRQPAAGWRPSTTAGRLPPAYARQPRLGYASDPAPASPGLMQSAVVRRDRGLPMREALILSIVFHHPGLLLRHAEELAGVESESAEFSALRDSLLTAAADAGEDIEGLRRCVDGPEFAPLRRRLAATDAVSALSCVRADAAEETAAVTLLQALTLHHKTRALHKELKSAELAFVSEGTEANFERLCRVRAEISAVEGMEASSESVDALSDLSGRHG